MAKAKVGSGRTAARRISKKKVSTPTVDRTKLKTHVLLVLDRSGSMAEVKDATITGFNQQAATIRANASEGGKTFVSLTTFATDVKFDRWKQPAEMLTDLSAFTYYPNGGTALYDAIGRTIDRIKNEVQDDENTAYLMIVLTDGDENSSQVFHGPLLSTIISALQATGRWSFVVSGANINLAELAGTLSIPLANTMAFAASADGVNTIYTTNSTNTGTYLRSRGIGQTQTKSFYAPEKP